MKPIHHQAWHHQHQPEKIARVVPWEESLWACSNTWDRSWWCDLRVAHHLRVPGWSLPREQADSFIAFCQSSAEDDAGAFLQGMATCIKIQKVLFLYLPLKPIYNDAAVWQMMPYFYKIPMGRRNGDDISGPEAELKEKLAKLDKVG